MTTTHAAIFDLDGLIVDTEAVWRRALEAVFRDENIQIADEMHEAVRGMQIRDKAAFILKTLGLPTEPAAQLASRVDEEAAKVIVIQSRLKPGVEHALDMFESIGWRLAIGSGSPPSIIEAQLGHFGLLERFGTLCSTHHEIQGKPHPAVFLRAAERLSVSPFRCVVLEDAPNVVLAARSAGMKSIAVPEGSPDEVRLAGAHKVLSSLTQLAAAMATGLMSRPRLHLA